MCFPIQKTVVIVHNKQKINSISAFSIRTNLDHCCTHFQLDPECPQILLPHFGYCNKILMNACKWHFHCPCYKVALVLKNIQTNFDYNF